MEHCCHHHDENNQDMKSLCISIVPIFNHLQFNEMLEIVKTSKTKTYKKGEMVFRAGEPSDHLYIVHKGQVKIYRLSESGKEQLIRIMEPGDFMGELALFTDESLTSYAEAMKDTEICAIHKTEMKEMLLSNPSISLKIIEEFSRRLNDTEKNIESISSHDSEKRLASYLLGLSAGNDEVGTDHEPIQITLPMSKKDLASYMGMTRETLSRRLSSFQDQGLISMTGQRKITILDVDALSEIENGEN
ncbi:Crp/Fnr family transcriptional regulator [Schinkia azotoformans]|uniref:Crp/Fnr family transcriptional regulator n=1 Tax=Schinkia azotoformans TaxID=1454 RepID=UPI002DBC9BB8|nr:Crp/Fnr family transcriptional regulator [Schinkia azotoformans]MEC1721294.1 Crp/Fnr family transcriptional regulator [Schinkia azotoformans]MED4351631.1 Crp/Fnr family transcriptional regulator [Schinkia azotoformans]MED4414441.1 Crp/Fnr family transcriptional regulator [Schinkia azotoformans]